MRAAQSIICTTCLVISIAATLTAGLTQAQQEFPTKSIRIIVGFPPGSSTDTTARLLAQKLAEAWGKPLLVENVIGAAGSISAERLAKAVPDGYTLGILGQTQTVINPGLYKLTYDPVKDFMPLSQISASLNVLVVHNAVPAKSVKALVALAKAQPGLITYASGGTGSSAHMATELFKSATGIDIRHIPYKGAVAAIPDLLSGRVMMMISPVALSLRPTRDGRLTALAVTSLRRSAAAPELPTIAESGYPGFEVTSWQGLLAPARTPAMIADKLYSETVKALALPDLRAKLADLGLDVIGNSPDEFAAVIKSEIPKWAKVIKDAGIKAD